MATNPIEQWHNIVRTRDTSGLTDLLADDVIFHSPVVHTPQLGRGITTVYLTAAVQVLGSGPFRYVREIVGENDAVLEFETEIDGIFVNGVDIFSWNDEGLITEFKVMIRPLKAIGLVHELMRSRLERTR